MKLQFFLKILISVLFMFYLYQYNCKAGDSLMIFIYCSAVITLISFVTRLVRTNGYYSNIIRDEISSY